MTNPPELTAAGDTKSILFWSNGLEALVYVCLFIIVFEGKFDIDLLSGKRSNEDMKEVVTENEFGEFWCVVCTRDQFSLCTHLFCVACTWPSEWNHFIVAFKCSTPQFRQMWFVSLFVFIFISISIFFSRRNSVSKSIGNFCFFRTDQSTGLIRFSCNFK